jgi:hypothetical protein
MFQLTEKEWEDLRSQIATSKNTRGGRRYLPYVFTGQGVAISVFVVIAILVFRKKALTVFEFKTTQVPLKYHACTTQV